MTVYTWTTLTDLVLAFKKPVTYVLLRQFRDNLSAAFQGYTTAPRLAHQALSYQDFTASGTFIVPDYVTKVYVETVGGGGGAPGATSSGLVSGGCAGGRAEGWQTVTPGDNIPVTIGAGGSSAGSGSDTATDGGTSSFGSPVLISATGGSRGRFTAAITTYSALYTFQFQHRGGIGVGGDKQERGSSGAINNNNDITNAEGGRGVGGIGGNNSTSAPTIYGEGGRASNFSSGASGTAGKSGFVRVWY